MSDYLAVRERVGLIVRSYRSLIRVSGPDRFTWLQGMVSNDVRRLETDSTAILACILDSTGHLVSDLAIVRADDSLLLDLPVQNEARVYETLDQFLIVEDVELEIVTGQYRVVSLQGPESASAVAGISLPAGSIIASADHSGEGGFDIYLTDLLDSGIDIVSAETAETLRIEAGIPSFGQDMDEKTIPLEAGLGHTHISHTKGCYVGQEIIHRIYSRGHTNRELTGFVAHAESAPSRLEKVYGLGAEPGKEIGWITSVTDSPAVGAFIALGYLRHEYRESATQLASGSGIPLTVHELPFYRRP